MRWHYLSKDWIRRRKKDPYYRKAKAEGYRSRAAYKLREINERTRLIRKGYRVLDLGAAPGGWSQIARDIVGEEGEVIAVDLVGMTMEGVRFIQGDIEDPELLEMITQVVPTFHAVISDASVNLSGNRTFDRGRNFALGWAVLKLAREVLVPGGSCVLKLFSGVEVDELKEEFSVDFREFSILKPRSSIKSSSEIFLLFRGYRPRSGD